MVWTSVTSMSARKKQLDLSGEVMMLGKRWAVVWIGWKGELFIWNGFRFNGGGYLYGAAPYNYWRIGPIQVMRYM